MLYFLGGGVAILPWWQDLYLKGLGSREAYRLPTAGRESAANWTKIEDLPNEVYQTSSPCTQAALGGGIWSMTGRDYDPTENGGWLLHYRKDNVSRQTPGERCPMPDADVTWLGLSTTVVAVGAGGSAQVQITADTRSLQPGI